MFDEAEEPRGPSQLVATPSLDRLGIAELESYIAALRSEIGRAEAEITRKAGHRSAADAFFKT